MSQPDSNLEPVMTPEAAMAEIEHDEPEHVWNPELSANVYEKLARYDALESDLHSLVDDSGYDTFKKRQFVGTKRQLQSALDDVYRQIISIIENEELLYLIDADREKTLANLRKDLPPRSNIRMRKYIDARGRADS